MEVVRGFTRKDSAPPLTVGRGCGMGAVPRGRLEVWRAEGGVWTMDLEGMRLMYDSGLGMNSLIASRLEMHNP